MKSMLYNKKCKQRGDLQMTKKEMLKDLQQRAREMAEQTEEVMKFLEGCGVTKNIDYYEGEKTAFEAFERLLENYEFML